jgi:hypothetical protein
VQIKLNPTDAAIILRNDGTFESLTPSEDSTTFVMLQVLNHLLRSEPLISLIVEHPVHGLVAAGVLTPRSSVQEP